MSNKYFSGILSRESDDEDISKDIVSKFKKGQEANREAIGIAEKHRKYYKGIPPELPEHRHQDDPNLFVPYTEVLVDTIVAKFFISLFAQNPIIRYKPENLESKLATFPTSPGLMVLLESNLYLNCAIADFSPGFSA